LITSIKNWPIKGTGEDENKRLKEHLEDALVIVADVAEPQQREAVVKECMSRMERCSNDLLRLAWLKCLFRFDVEKGEEKLIELLGQPKYREARLRAVEIFAYLFDRRLVGGVASAIPNHGGRACLLGKLVRAAAAFIRYDEDISHEGVYLPNSRDAAEGARNALLDRLFETSGCEAHRVMLELAGEPDFEAHADRLRWLARRKGAEDAEFKAYTIDQVQSFERNLEAPPLDRDGLFNIMLDRLDDIARDLCHGDFSDQQLLRKCRKEIDMQRYLAGRLDRNSKSAYRVVREPKVKDRKRPDIQLAAVEGDQRVVVEVKIPDELSISYLKQALRDQLCGRYLLPGTCTAGCLLLMYAGDRKTGKWQVDRSNRKKDVDFNGLIDHLNEFAKSLENISHGRIRLKVKGIDLTVTKVEFD